MYINSYIFSDIKNIIIFRRESEFTFTCNVIRVACCTKPFWSRGRFAANNNKFHHKHHIDPFLATINSHKASSLVIAPLFCAAHSSLIIQYQLPTLPRSTKISFFSSYPALTPLVSSLPLQNNVRHRRCRFGALDRAGHHHHTPQHVFCWRCEDQRS